MSVSVIIPSYNRFNYLLNAIESVRSQTYKPVQIIVVNDGSTQPEYRSHDFGNDVTVVHLSKNARDILGSKSPGGIQRNIGIQIATGEYIAFLDDDDVWLSSKLELQVKAMKETKCAMSCAEGYYGIGIYNKEKTYEKYNSEKFYTTLQGIYGGNILSAGFPTKWNHNFFSVHNCAIASSVVINKDLLKMIGGFRLMPYADDYDCWLRVTQYTDCVYIDEPCVYYDAGHGDGINY